MKLSFWSLVLLLIAPVIALGNPDEINVVQLRCEYLSNPAVIDNKTPNLGWQLLTAHQGKQQKSYRILVASTLSLLKAGKGDYWDSGKIKSDNSTQIRYSGKPLTSRTRLYWKVMVWDEKGKPAAWSQPAWWTMGLLQASDWKAKWIGDAEDLYPDSAITGPAPFFRKEFDAKKKIKSAKVYISGLGFYELSINGKKVGDQVLAPAVTNYDKRSLKKLLYPYDDQSSQRVLYNCFDVTSYLNQATNAIGVHLGNGWYNQRDRTVEGNMWYDTPRFICQLEIAFTDGTHSTFISDATWRTTTGPLIHNGIFTGEQYDARRELKDWDKASYVDKNWKPTVLVRVPAGRLIAQTAPFDRVMRSLKPRFAGRKMDSIYTYQLDETIAGWASLRVKGKSGNKIKIRYISEEGEDYGQFDTYTLKGTETEVWEPKFTWHAFRKIEVISKDLELDGASLVVKEVHTDVAPNGYFECSNPFINKINQAYRKTQNTNFHGSISSDCPHRERLGYTGDGQVTVEASILSYDMRQFYRKWFDDMDDARNKKTGFVTHSAPFGGGGGGPAWGSALVIMPWQYYSYYGDTTTLLKYYAGMKQWVDYLGTRTDENGLIVREEPNGWCLGDWCTPANVEIPAEFVNTAYYYHVSQIMANVAAVLGKSEDQVAFGTLSKKIKAAFNKAYYDANKHSYWQGRQGSDVFALAFGLEPEGEHSAVFNSLLSHLESINYHFDTGILGTPLLLKVLSENNRDDIAYKIMNQKDFPGFGYLQDSNNSHLWETWDGQGSKSHPMFGSVIAWLYNGLAGINTDSASPGMKHFIISPKPAADLTYCKSAYESPFGKIRSEWKKETDGKLYVVLEIPGNTSATFILPADRQKIKNDAGKDIPVKNINGRYETKLTSGTYRFEVL